jgi:opacity protein-like surface antigen
MSRTSTWVLAIAATLASPAALSAQGSVTLVPPDAPRWDAAVYTGWYGAARSGAATWDDWTQTGFGGGSASFAWTTHFRTEFDVSVSGRGRVYAPATIFIPGQPGPIVRTEERRYRDTAVAASFLYDPLENRWVQPFIGAGVGIVREHLRIDAPEWIYYGRPPGGVVVPAQPTTTDVAYRAAPHVIGGARFYVTERAFIRTDLRVAVAGDQPSAQLRIGVGFDF